MDVTQTYSDTLKALGDALVALTSPDFDILLQQASRDTRTAISRLIVRVEGARLQLGNALLSQISDQLKANEPDLTAGVASVNAAVAKLDNVAEVLDTLTSLIGVVGKIVALV